MKTEQSCYIQQRRIRGSRTCDWYMTTAKLLYARIQPSVYSVRLSPRNHFELAYNVLHRAKLCAIIVGDGAEAIDQSKQLEI